MNHRRCSLSNSRTFCATCARVSTSLRKSFLHLTAMHGGYTTSIILFIQPKKAARSLSKKARSNDLQANRYCLVGRGRTMPCLTRSAGRRPACKRGQLAVQSKMPEGVGHVGTLLLAPCAPRPGVEAAELIPSGPEVIEPRRLPCTRVRPNTTCSEMMETVPGLFVEFCMLLRRLAGEFHLNLNSWDNGHALGLQMRMSNRIQHSTVTQLKKINIKGK